MAETRIAERQKRPTTEFVNDPATQRLVREVGEIKDVQKELQSQLKQAQEEERALRRAALALQDDIDCKINSINIDNGLVSTADLVEMVLIIYIYGTGACSSGSSTSTVSSSHRCLQTSTHCAWIDLLIRHLEHP